MKLTEEQIIKLLEESLNMRLWYYYDSLKDEKRPFGNSGYSEIFHDICNLLKIKNKFEVDDEDELYNLKYKFVIDCFSQIENWSKNKADKFVVTLKKKSVKE